MLVDKQKEATVSQLVSGCLQNKKAATTYRTTRATVLVYGGSMQKEYNLLLSQISPCLLLCARLGKL